MSTREAQPQIPLASNSFNALKSAIPIVIGISLAIAFQFTIPNALGPYYSRLVIDAGIAMILAVSLNIVNGMTGQFSIGHAGFMTVGAYTAGMISFYGSLLLWGDSVKHGSFLGSGEWMFLTACLTGGVVAAFAGLVVGLPSLRLRGDYLAIVTLGFGEILRVILQQTGKVVDDPAIVREAPLTTLASLPVGGAIGFDGIPKYTSLFWVYAMLSLTVIFAYRLKNSSFGRAMLSVREDEIAAQAMGINIARQKTLAFVMAAFFAGVGGGLLAHEGGVIISPKDAGFQRSFDYVIMTVLGGRGSITGVMLAAVLLSGLPEVLRDFERYRIIVYALLLIIMMLSRPQGLFGIHEIWDYFPKSWKKSSRKGAAR